VAFSNFSLAETDLVLAEKDAVGKFAAAATTFFVRRSEKSRSSGCNLFAAIWQSNRNKSADFCIDISIQLH